MRGCTVCLIMEYLLNLKHDNHALNTNVMQRKHQHRHKPVLLGTMHVGRHGSLLGGDAVLGLELKRMSCVCQRNSHNVHRGPSEAASCKQGMLELKAKDGFNRADHRKSRHNQQDRILFILAFVCKLVDILH